MQFQLGQMVKNKYTGKVLPVTGIAVYLHDNPKFQTFDASSDSFAWWEETALEAVEQQPSE